MSCDIIIPVWNQLEYTKAALAALFKFTSFPFRLIVVDNASAEPTRLLLQRVQNEHPEQVTIIRNAENRGFIKAVNEGIRVSTAEYICLLNNDTEVACGWLVEMVKVAQLREDIGIVNPNSNTLGFKLKKGQSLEAVAQELKAETGQWAELAWATGFCMLIKRRVIEKVGLLDEIFGMGMFEDADFSKRAQKQGYLSVCARAAFVYHRERRSFIRHKGFDANFEKNRQIFFSRWGRQERILYILFNEDNGYADRKNTEALHLARQGAVLWMFRRKIAGQDEGSMPFHSNIYRYDVPALFFGARCLWRILKKKKRFDKIYVNNMKFANFLNNFKVIHKAEVVYEQ